MAVFDENDGIESTGFFWFGAAMLVLFICFIAGASFEDWPIGKLGMGFVAMAFAITMLVRYKAEAGTRRLGKIRKVERLENVMKTTGYV